LRAYGLQLVDRAGEPLDLLFVQLELVGHHPQRAPNTEQRAMVMSRPVPMTRSVPVIAAGVKAVAASVLMLSCRVHEGARAFPLKESGMHCRVSFAGAFAPSGL